MDTDTESPSISQLLRSYPFRFAIYVAITFAVFECVYFGVRTRGAAVMGAENGPIEATQAVLAIVGAIGLFCAARWTVIGRAGLVLCGAVVAYAAARESDLLFETYLFDDAYKWLVGLPMAILCLLVIVADRRRLVPDTLCLMRHPSATLFAVAGLFLCFVCQILDRPEMWVGISNGAEMETTKALIEEFAELFAYLLLAFSGIEAVTLARRARAIAGDANTAAEQAEIYRIAA